MDERKDSFEGEVKMKSPLLEKLENFWYYHKWHTLIGLFLVITLTVLTVQMCQKKSFDAHILYAGNHEVKRVSASGDSSPYVNMMSELKLVVNDKDGDGEVNIDLKTLFVVNGEEAEELIGGNESYEINEALVREDAEALYQYMRMSDYYVCFLSERLFNEISAENSCIFTPLAKYASTDRSYDWLGDSGIYLKSIADFSTLPEFSNLPDDTVICLRALSDMSKSRYEKTFIASEDIIRRILSYSK